MRTYLVGIVTIPLFAGCASYRAISLPMLQPEFCAKSETVDGVTVCTRAFSPEDCREYFDKDLITKGYQPVQFTVYNDTPSYVMLNQDSISLPLVPPDDVARKAHRNTAGRATAYGVGGLLLWPLLIPAVVDGVSSSQANQQMDSDFSAKGIGNEVIQPYSHLNGVVFTPTDGFAGDYRMTLISRETEKALRFTWSDEVVAQRELGSTE